jgi:hypothetical protein
MTSSVLLLAFASFSLLKVYLTQRLLAAEISSVQSVQQLQRL